MACHSVKVYETLSFVNLQQCNERDRMELEFIAATDTEFEEIFACVKQGLHTHIEQVFGWDDEFQRDRLRNSYQQAWFHWVVEEGDKVGLACFKRYDNAMHLHLLIVFPSKQRQGVGHRVMERLKELACREGREALTLSSFAVNTQAVKLYQSLGYQITDSDEQFVSMKLAL